MLKIRQIDFYLNCTVFCGIVTYIRISLPETVIKFPKAVQKTHHQEMRRKEDENVHAKDCT